MLTLSLLTSHEGLSYPSLAHWYQCYPVRWGSRAKGSSVDQGSSLAPVPASPFLAGPLTPKERHTELAPGFL